jgi:hypothetical protein
MINRTNPPSRIHAIKLDKLDDGPHDVVVPGGEDELVVVIYPGSDESVNHGAQPGHEHADAGPPAQAQPAVDEQAPAERVELDLAGEEEERVGVECCVVCVWV